MGQDSNYLQKINKAIKEKKYNEALKLCNDGIKNYKDNELMKLSISFNKNLIERKLSYSIDTGSIKKEISRFVDSKNQVVYSKKEKVVFYGINTPTGFSGGRYHAWLMAEAAAELGYDVSYITNNKPSFYSDFDAPLFPAHNNIKLEYHNFEEEFCDLPDIRCDILVVVPHNKIHGTFVDKALTFAKMNSSKIILINFESPNWYNSLSPIPRNIKDWDGWQQISERASMILSISHEGQKYAKEFYKLIQAGTVFDVLWPTVNTRMADTVPDVTKEKRIIFFVRFSNEEHKGNNLIPEVLCEAMRGYTVVFIVGGGAIEESLLKGINEKAEKLEIKLEFSRNISEYKKWEQLKRASLVIYPSYFEGFGLPPVEAQYANTPCIAFDLPVLREVSGDNIFYVPAGNTEEMIVTINKILHLPEKGYSCNKLKDHDSIFSLFSKKLNDIFSKVRNLNVPVASKAENEIELKFTKYKSSQVILFSGILNIYKVKFLNNLNKSFNNYGYQLIWLSEKNLEPSPMTPLKSDIEFEFIEIPKLMGILFRNQYKNSDQFNPIDNDIISLQAKHENKKQEKISLELDTYYLVIKQLINFFNIKLVILWHQFRAKHLIFQSLCEKLNIPYLFTEWGLLPGTIAFDAYGQMAESLVLKNSTKFKSLVINSIDVNKALSLVELLRTQHVRRRKEGRDKNDIHSIIKIARLKNRTIIFYAGQNDCYAGLFPDTNPRRIEHSPIYKNTFDALIHLSDLALKNNWQIIFKPHPILSKLEIPPEITNKINIEHVSIVNNADFFQCIELSDVCTTILSQSAYMFLLYEKPTVLLGRLQLSGKKCCWEATEFSKVEQTFKYAINDGYTREQYFHFIKHVAQLLRYHLFPLESKVIDSDNADKELIEKKISEHMHIRNINDLASLLIEYGNNPNIETGFPFDIHNSLYKSEQASIDNAINKTVVFYGINSSTKFSGGRYHSWLMAEACAELGWSVYYLTNDRPSFYNELEEYKIFSSHKKINLIILPINKPNCTIPNIHCDVFVYIPHANCHGKFTDNALNFAKNNAKHIALLNFESANWFNSMSPEKRKESMWEGWKIVSKQASLIFSLTKEGTKYAIPFYNDVRNDVVFDHCYSPINTRIANLISDKIKEKRIHVFTRLNAAHKGKNLLIELLDSSLSGYTLVLIIGSPIEDVLYFETLENKAKEYDIIIEVKNTISEIEKWTELKRSSLLIFPSLFEGFGMPPGEALYCNTPCVAFDIPVLREIYGDALTYVEPNNINMMKKMINKLLNSNLPNHSNLKSIIHNKLDFEIFSLTINKLFSRLLQNSNNHSNNTSSLKIDSSIKKIKEIQSYSKKRVIYFPFFNDSNELNNHFHRASWYLPKVDGVLDEVVIGCNSSIRPGSRPDYMCAPKLQNNHITLINSEEQYNKELKTASLILYWRKLNPQENKLLQSLNTIKSNIDTNNENCIEYGSYCKVHWTLMDKSSTDLLLNNSYKRFLSFAEMLKSKMYDSAVSFCTGPSIDQAIRYNFNKCFKHICNTIINSDELMEHIKPDLISAGDVVSHFGVSTYADKFRMQLSNILKKTDCYFLTSAKFGNLFRIHYPELEHKIILCDQRSQPTPNYDLIKKWSLPVLDSVLNILLLPTCATLFKNIFVMGADGKNPDLSKNEDFWAHSKLAQYHDLVDTGHLCHPTFDINRQKKTFNRYIDSTKTTIQLGEINHGKKYFSLTKSYTPGLAERYISNEELNKLSFGPKLIK